jgi:RNA polymerase sigma-70 factor (ECF subfamily)
MELLQAAATAACRAFADFGGGDDFRVWFLAFVTSIAGASTCRDFPGSEAQDLDDTPDLLIYARSAAAGLPTGGDRPAAELLDRLGTERVMAALRRLPGEYRIVCALSFLADLTYEEIGRVQSYPMGTARSRLHRGRKMLQKALWAVAEADGLTGQERRTP